jgi:hypothetical protein
MEDQKKAPLTTTSTSHKKPRDPQRALKWAVVSIMCIAGSQACSIRSGGFDVSLNALAGVIGGALPSWAFAMLCSMRVRGYPGIVVGISVASVILFLQWLGSAPV